MNSASIPNIASGEPVPVEPSTGNTGSLAVGIDLGGTNIKVGLVDSGCTIHSRMDRPCDASKGPEQVIANMVESARRIVEDHQTDWSNIIGVGIGSPGPLSIREGRIAKMANLPGWNNVPLRDRISDALDRPAWLDNDANTAAFGEWWARKGQRADDLVLMTLGTGVGFGVVVNGSLFHGHFENAAELGHMIVCLNGEPCPCGQRGCLEQYASATAVAHRAGLAIDQGETSTLQVVRSAGEVIQAHHVAEAAARGDGLATRVWDEACQFVAIAIINLQHSFNPARVLLGGGLAKAGDQLLTTVGEHLARQRWNLFEDVPEIGLASLGYDAGIVGAAALVWSQQERGAGLSA